MISLICPRFARQSLVWLGCLAFVISGCSGSSSTTGKSNPTSNSDKKTILVGSWTNRDKTRFLEITAAGSIVVHKKGASDEDIGFYEIDGDRIRIYKDKQTAEGRTEISRLDIISEHEILFGENQEYWNVVNVAGRWFREGVNIDEVIAEKERQKLTPEEQHLADIRQKRADCQELIQTLEGDRKSYLVKLSKLDEQQQADSWKLNASMLAKTQQRLKNANYKLDKLVRAEEALTTLIADQKRTQQMKQAGLDEDGLEKILLSIGETESKLPIDDEQTEFELRNLVEEELKTLETEADSGKNPKSK